MRSARVRDAVNGGEISDASVVEEGSIACQRCCVGVSSRMLQRALLVAVHPFPNVSKSSDALCFGSSCALTRKVVMDDAWPETKSGSRTGTRRVGEDAAVPVSS